MAKVEVIEERQPAAESEVPEGPVCQHHWKIESPRGALSTGRCKRCGEEREFRNSTTDYSWDDDSGGGYSPWRGVKSTPRAADDDEVAAAPRSRGDALLV